MIITRRPWSELPVPCLVVAPDGRIWKLVGRHDGNHGPCVELSDPTDNSPASLPTSFTVVPSHTVETIVTDATLEDAVAILSGSFALQRM